MSTKLARQRPPLNEIAVDLELVAQQAQQSDRCGPVYQQHDPDNAAVRGYLCAGRLNQMFKAAATGARDSSHADLAGCVYPRETASRLWGLHVGDDDLSPVGRFSPAAGIWVDRTTTRTEITGAMELFGPEANHARAQSVMHSINTTWTSSFPDGYRVSCSVLVRYRSEGVSAGHVAQIEAIKISAPSHVNMFTRSMTLNANETEAFTWTAAHEFGHVLGLQDRYSEGIVSQILGTFGGTRTTTVDPRYQANLMAVSGGVLEARNLQDLASENTPSWLNDDDRVLAWVMHHELGDVTALSTKQKLAMLRTLAGGWIAREDEAGIVRICSSVRDPQQANAIRAGLDLLSFTDIGQRTRIRVAFSRMP